MLQYVPYWPEGVVLTNKGIHDVVREDFFSTNAVATFLAAQIDGQRTGFDIAVILAHIYQLEPEMAQTETHLYLQNLNRQLLLNFRVNYSTCLNSTVCWATFKAWMLSLLTYQRHVLDFAQGWRTYLRFFWIVGINIKLLWSLPLLGIVLSACIFLWGEKNVMWLVLISVFTSVCFSFGFLSSIAIHELSHARVWSYLSSKKQVLVGINPVSAFVVCHEQSTKQDVLVALSGPVGNVFFCVFVLLLSVCFTNNDLQMGCWIVAMIQGLVGLFALFTTDGKTVLVCFLK